MTSAAASSLPPPLPTRMWLLCVSFVPHDKSTPSALPLCKKEENEEAFEGAW